MSYLNQFERLQKQILITMIYDYLNTVSAIDVFSREKYQLIIGLKLYLKNWIKLKQEKTYFITIKPFSIHKYPKVYKYLRKSVT